MMKRARSESTDSLNSEHSDADAAPDRMPAAGPLAESPIAPPALALVAAPPVARAPDPPRRVLVILGFGRDAHINAASALSRPMAIVERTATQYNQRMQPAAARFDRVYVLPTCALKCCAERLRGWAAPPAGLVTHSIVVAPEGDETRDAAARAPELLEALCARSAGALAVCDPLAVLSAGWLYEHRLAPGCAAQHAVSPLARRAPDVGGAQPRPCAAAAAPPPRASAATRTRGTDPQLAQMGVETVAILREGGYAAPSGAWVDLSDALQSAKDASLEYPPDNQPRPPPRAQGLPPRTTITRVENATVLDVGRRMAAQGAVTALNFASATSPGGGFLRGCLAQEESLARSSGLFLCLEGREMYEQVWIDHTYADYVIYSPGVPVIRDHAGRLLEMPWRLNVLTCPAVNGRLLIGCDADVPAVMRARMDKMLAVVVAHGQRRLVLGAWGCGAFGLAPAMMAGLFFDALTGAFAGCFDEIVFAIVDSPKQYVIGPFLRAFSE